MCSFFVVFFLLNFALCIKYRYSVLLMKTMKCYKKKIIYVMNISNF